MPETAILKSTKTTSPKGRAERFIEELIVDILITAAIVWGLVLLGEPLTHVLTSPLLIILTGGGLIRLVYKTVRPKKSANDD